MTCIVSFKTESGSVVIAGDYMASDGHHFTKVKSPKVFAKAANCFVGYTSSFRMGQILQNCWSLPPKMEGQDTESYVYLDIVESLRATFNSYGYGSKAGIEDIAGNFILIYEDRIFEIQSNYSVLEIDSDIVAIGSGRDAALGALHSLLPISGDDEDELEALLSTVFSSVNKVTASVSADFMYLVAEE